MPALLADAFPGVRNYLDASSFLFAGGASSIFGWGERADSKGSKLMSKNHVLMDGPHELSSQKDRWWLNGRRISKNILSTLRILGQRYLQSAK
jgi:hypothetical protein